MKMLLMIRSSMYDQTSEDDAWLFEMSEKVAMQVREVTNETALNKSGMREGPLRKIDTPCFGVT